MSSANDKTSALQLTKYQTIEDDILNRSTSHYQDDVEEEEGGLGQTTTRRTRRSDKNEDDDELCSERIPWYFILILLITMFVIIVWFLFSTSPSVEHNMEVINMSSVFDNLGRYVMKDYDETKPMANFLPALGGVWGYPMWAFFVNRGQGITAFGVDNKDGGIAKFNTAEKAYQQTPFTGFRTFVKGVKESSTFESMPFAPHFSEVCEEKKPKRTMSIGMNEMELSEYNPVTKLRTNILYFTAPHEEFALLIRRVTFTNEGSEDMYLEVLDGLAKIEPSGIPNGNLDSMGRTMEAWMNVYNMDENSDKTQPFFHASQGTADTAEVQVIKDGHFSLAFVEEQATHHPVDHKHRGLERHESDLDPEEHIRLPFIVDPTVIFGTDTVLTYPSEFFGAKGKHLDDLMGSPQGTTSRTPCAFTGSGFTLKGGENVSLVSMYGHASSIEVFTEKNSPKLLKKDYVTKKRGAATDLVKEITERIDTQTSSHIFNEYIKQNFLDNVLRGGLPVQLGAEKSHSVDDFAVQTSDDIDRPKIYHVFSRIHGDLERDYNNFDIDTTFFSQGPGNFRDVSQNRRSDVAYTPAVGDFDLRMFLSFVQADGYNPLTVASTLFKVPDDGMKKMIEDLHISKPKHRVSAEKILSQPFRPGKLLKDFEAAGIETGVEGYDLVHVLMTNSHQIFAAQYAQNGFWADHWTYTLDQIKSFVSIFPDKEEEMLWDSEKIPFFVSPAYVRPRSARYELVDDKARPGQKTIRVYRALSQWGELDFPDKKLRGMMRLFKDPSYVVSSDGSAGVWQQSADRTTFKVAPITKLTMLALIKFSTMDPYGMGVEMEGGKPGWNDAMNGLPGIIGSGMPETYELLLIVRFVRQAITKYGRSVSFPMEFSNMLDGLSRALKKFNGSSRSIADEFSYWDTSNNLREYYREKTLIEFSGATADWSSERLINFLDEVESKVMAGISRAQKTNGGLSPTYFYYECVEYDLYENATADTQVVTPKKFDVQTLPLFLEGPVRHMKIVDDVDLKRQIYERARTSELYDSDLQMFKISGSLKNMGQEIGRMMAFSSGWLENESVWLHMSYKFYLELLRGGLYDAFYHEIKTGLVPFMDEEVYGRSPLEAASFIVSSVFPDEKLHGASFDARLSGSTAEFLSMWQLIMQGPQPFIVNEKGELNLSLQPAIASWLFKEDATVSFVFLGVTRVTYHNTLFQDTWNMRPTHFKLKLFDGSHHTEEGLVIGPEMALATRNLKVKAIDVYFD